MKIERAKKYLHILLSLLLALYMLIALRMNVSPTETADSLSMLQAVHHALDGPAWAVLLLYAALAALTMAAAHIGCTGIGQLVFAGLPAVFLAFCTCVGKAFIDPDWGNLVISLSWLRMQKWLFCFPGWFFLGFAAMIVLYHLLDRLAQKHRKQHGTGKNAWIRAFEAHPFAAPLLVLLVCYVPVLILSLPGLVMPADTANQIMQSYGKIAPGLARIYEDGTLTNHHPVVHTMLLHVFLELGKCVFGSAQAGLSIFVCLQVLLTACVLAWMLCELHEQGASGYACLAAAVFLGLHPRIQNLIVLVSKDVLYADMLVLFGIGLMRLFAGRPASMRILLPSAVGMMLMRNEGVYILVGVMAMVFLLKRAHRRRAIVFAAGTMAFWMLWTGVLFPALHISPGSRREMLSVPFQQTGRYIAYHGDKVTEQERAVIDKVLVYDEIGINYKPNSADGVKDLYRESATDEDMKAYWKTWLSMFKKYPMTYVEAILENKNQLLYPTSSRIFLEDTAHYYIESAADLQVISDVCVDEEIQLSYPKALEKLRFGYERLRESVFALPGLHLLTQNAPYVWVIVILLCYALYRRRIHTLLLMVPIVLQIMVIFVGPLDGNTFRYMYPVVLYLPLPLMSALYMKQGE